MRRIIFFLFLINIFSSHRRPEPNTWIRINLLGYEPNGIKVAVWCTKDESFIKHCQRIDSASGEIVFQNTAGKAFGPYGPFTQTFRLNFSSFKKSGTFYLKGGSAVSPFFKIANDVYKGSADFCLRYMRQQRSGFNPFLQDSCHTHDGYTLYGPMADSTHVDVSGGWHDASDYLQYSTTSANATYHLLMAYRDFPFVFSDEKLSNGRDGKNGIADILDEARWGLDWLLKMHPRDDWMFNQIADDRDHMGMRIPKEDTFYHKGFERPVYFISGEPQQRGKFMNDTKGTSSTAAKFSSAFALGSKIYSTLNPSFSDSLYRKSLSAYAFAKRKEGVTQTASVRSPYIYAEENWVDDMELALAAQGSLSQTLRTTDSKRNQIDSPNSGGSLASLLSASFSFAKREPFTPWLGKDTASHYQWYPFINLGHYELARQLTGKKRDTVVGFYKEGIRRVWNKAKANGFYRGVPFIWCSNNLTTSFAIQCLWYKQLSGDKQFDELAQANFDWLFGCNPWGTSMVFGLPAPGDTPSDPHSAFTHLKNYPIDGG
ncbi:MAG: glycoside hydrolase family 9 protein, partial [Flavisolibacter sp.]